MASCAELPELPANAALITYLRSQASPPDGPGDYTLGPWQLHTHPDLISLLRSLAPDLPVTAAYGVRCSHQKASLPSSPWAWTG